VLKDGNVSPFVNETTSGAAYNFEQLADPKTPFKIALMQMDYLYFMQGMDHQNNTNKTNDIKVLMPLANEEIHFVTKQSSGLNKLSDLDSSSIVAIGSKNQGTYATSSFIKDRSEIYWSSRNIHFDQALKDLFLDKIDAFVFVGSAPVVKLNIDPRGLRSPLNLLELDDFNDWAKNYDRDTIYTTDYKWLDKDVPTYSVRTVIIVNESKLTNDDREALQKMMNGIKNNYDKLVKEGHPKWKDVKFDDWDKSEWPKIRL
jgi:TRAP-type uncharacterized transport system substrate-binding protein